MSHYDPKSIEEKWLTKWEKDELFQNSVTPLRSSSYEGRSKFYALFAFAYPSGSGLHVGHVESKTALDILVRFLRMSGKDVFFPVGWDAFGLPAENYAIQTGIHPRTTTKNAIDTFASQIKRVGVSYDWTTELATCHPEYYKWTQWIFTQLFQAGLAYRDKGWVNWCPSDKTVLANEQVVEGKCERCGTSVVQKELEQWKFRITKYQDELLSGLDQVDWPKATKVQQENWIGKSKGLQIKFQISNFKFQTDNKTQIPKDLSVWTKFWETVFGVTFVVIAPERFKEFGLMDLVGASFMKPVADYIDAAFHKTEEQRRIGEKDKTGVDTRLKLINPVNGQEVPLYIADYVLMNVGTGVVMGVPSHDERDFAFAKKFNIPLLQVVAYEDEVINTKVARGEDSHEGEGKLVNSGAFDGMDAWGDGKEKMAVWMIEQGYAKWQTTYRLRDWLISRQRYWGCPIPMVYCDTCAKKGTSWFTIQKTQSTQNARMSENRKPDTPISRSSEFSESSESMPGWYPVEEKDLPVLLPEIADFTPTDDGKSPLEKADSSWIYTDCPSCGGKAKREVDTMDTFVDSSWYFLRYPSRNETKQVFDKEITEKLLPVDLYLIGPEHIVLHLLYARFFTKFLRDQGYITFDEPFIKMRHQGMILGPDGKKMSKSKGNVINPDDIIEKFGADTLRIYEMFMGPLEGDKAWDTNSLVGVYRFLTRIHTLFQKNTDQLENSKIQIPNSKSLQRKLHWAIDKVTRDIPELKFNTAIAALMELANEWSKAPNGFRHEELLIAVKLLAPFAPFLSEELYQMINDTMTNNQSVHLQNWPTADKSLLEETEAEIVVQVNGKLRNRFMIASDASREEIEKKALAFVDQTPKKVIVVPGKLVNIVI